MKLGSLKVTIVKKKQGDFFGKCQKKKQDESIFKVFSPLMEEIEVQRNTLRRSKR